MLHEIKRGEHIKGRAKDIELGIVSKHLHYMRLRYAALCTELPLCLHIFTFAVLNAIDIHIELREHFQKISVATAALKPFSASSSHAIVLDNMSVICTA